MTPLAQYFDIIRALSAETCIVLMVNVQILTEDPFRKPSWKRAPFATVIGLFNQRLSYLLPMLRL